MMGAPHLFAEAKTVRLEYDIEREQFGGELAIEVILRLGPTSTHAIALPVGEAEALARALAACVTYIREGVFDPPDGVVELPQPGGGAR